MQGKLIFEFFTNICISLFVTHFFIQVTFLIIFQPDEAATSLSPHCPTTLVLSARCSTVSSRNGLVNTCSLDPL